MRKLDIGVASYRNPEKLRRTLDCIIRRSRTEWRCFVIHNHSDDEEDAAASRIIAELSAADPRFIPVWLRPNVGYAGAVNQLLSAAWTRYVAYFDNDANVLTDGWDDLMLDHIEQYPEIGMLFPNDGVNPIDRGGYNEVMWGPGFAWMLDRQVALKIGNFDASLGHQEECDYALRVRMSGRKCAALPAVAVHHEATATNDPKQLERINAGVVNFVDKWCRYFGGQTLNYHSHNVLRWEDWPPNALYMEEWWKRQPQTKDLNLSPEETVINGANYDFVRVPRFRYFYRGRVI